MASFLIKEDELQKTEVAFIMGGGSYERGKEAYRLYKQGWFPKVICTGENIPSILEALGNEMTEAEVTAFYLMKEGLDSSAIEVINRSTSTMEEIAVILDYCAKNKITKCMIISSRFHTRRISGVLDELDAEDSGTEFILRGAPSLKFDEMKWWEREEGLIAFNNEWMKMVYYWWKY